MMRDSIFLLLSFCFITQLMGMEPQQERGAKGASARLAAALTAWAGYHGYTYNKLRKLPTPSDDDIYKRAAIALDPKFK